MNKPDAAIASVSLLAITASISTFGQLCPPLHEARQSKTGPNSTTYNVRTSEIAAASLALAIGLIGSELTGSPLPAVFAILAAGAMVAMYEGVLFMTPQEIKKGNRTK